MLCGVSKLVTSSTTSSEEMNALRVWRGTRVVSPCISVFPLFSLSVWQLKRTERQNCGIVRTWPHLHARPWQLASAGKRHSGSGLGLIPVSSIPNSTWMEKQLMAISHMRLGADQFDQAWEPISNQERSNQKSKQPEKEATKKEAEFHALDHGDRALPLPHLFSVR